MAKSGLKGSYPLTHDKIDEVVKRISPGTYALGYKNDTSFIIKYVGRSDSDLNNRLHDYIEEYGRFKYGYATSAKEAFKKECSLYHDFGESDKLDNDNHPDRPNKSNWECPICDIFDES